MTRRVWDVVVRAILGFAAGGVAALIGAEVGGFTPADPTPWFADPALAPVGWTTVVDCLGNCGALAPVMAAGMLAARVRPWPVLAVMTVISWVAAGTSVWLNPCNYGLHDGAVSFGAWAGAGLGAGGLGWAVRHRRRDRPRDEGADE